MERFELSRCIEGAPKGNAYPLRGLSFWEQALPWALIKILLFVPKIKLPVAGSEGGGVGGGLVVPGAGSVC